MKKHLLTATVATLMGFSAVFAQETTSVVYSQGAAVSSIDDLETGTYFIRAHANNANGDMSRGERMVQHTGVNQLFFLHEDYNIATETTDNTALIWKLVVEEASKPDDWDALNSGTFSGKVFSVQNVGTGAYISVRGGTIHDESMPSRHNILATTDESQAAKFQLVAMPADYTDYYGVQKDNTRFFLQITNSKFYNNGESPRTAYPYVHTNTGPVKLSYWADATIQGTAVQFDLVKAEEVNAVPVTVKFPAINGMDVEDQVVNMPLGKNPVESLESHISNMNKGDFNITNITSSTGNMTVAPGMVLTLEGSWEREVIPGKVYRLRIRPSEDACGAIRYMISTGEIETRRENAQATLNRLVPERLWYFTVEGEGDARVYLLHTLYDTDKAVKFTQTTSDWNHAHASLEEEGTPLMFKPREDGDFFLKVNESNSGWLNDFGGDGFLSVYVHNSGTDGGGIMRVYPLTDDDFAELAFFASDSEIAAAKADPTLENIKPLIDAYNNHNLEAAFKRVEYMIGSGAIGNNPGQYSDPSGDFAANYEYASSILAKGDEATEEEILKAVEGLDITGINADDLQFNEMTEGLYRLRNRQNSKYLSALSGGKAGQHDALAMTTDGTRSNTVFYVRANDTNADPGKVNYTVIAFEDGLVLPRLGRGTNNNESWLTTLEGSETASDHVNFSYQDNGSYVIHADGGDDSEHRHLHGGGNGTAANAGSGSDEGYQWYIERVHELPVTFYNVVGMDDEYGDDGWSSVYSPVALEVPADYHVTAYTGVFDGADYTGKPDVNHVHATAIAPQEDGRVIIPAGQVALLFYDGDADIDNDDYINGTATDRDWITYVSLPIAYDFTGESTKAGNLKGSFTAVPNDESKDFFTLHASHINNFREYSMWQEGYDYIPGFKAYITVNHIEDEEETLYPVYTINPNTMVAIQDEDGYNVSLDEEGNVLVTVTTASADYDVYYRQTAASAAQSRALDHGDFTKAEKSGNVHTMVVKDGNVEYYAYHADSDFQGVVRSATVDTTGISEITSADSAVKVYDVQGRKLAAPVKGINIVNGQKVLVK